MTLLLLLRGDAELNPGPTKNVTLWTLLVPKNCQLYRDVHFKVVFIKFSFGRNFDQKKVFHTFLYEDCKWETRYMCTYKHSLTKSWLKNMYRFLLKYALIEDCFRFLSWRSSILFVIVDNIFRLSSSEIGHRFILSGIVIISLKPKLSCSNSSFLSLLPPSWEISSSWSLAISGFWIPLMLSSLTHCRQSISNSLIIGSDAGIFS